MHGRKPKSHLSTLDQNSTTHCPTEKVKSFTFTPGVQFPAPTPGGSQAAVTPALQDPVPLDSVAPTHKCIHHPNPDKHMNIIKIHKNISLFLKGGTPPSGTHCSGGSG